MDRLLDYIFIFIQYQQLRNKIKELQIINGRKILYKIKMGKKNLIYLDNICIKEDMDRLLHFYAALSVSTAL